MQVLFADDHDLIRDTVFAFLQSESDIHVSTASNFNEAAALMEKAAPFDLVILDYNMPDMNGLDGLKKAMDLNFGSPVAIISGTTDRKTAEQALDMGAAGFLPKTMSAKSLINAIRFMVTGEQYAPIKYLTTVDEVIANPVADKLSGRELQVLEGLTHGHSNKEIARSLELQEVTIKLHVKTLCRKLDVRNRTQAAMAAKENGIF